MILEILKEINQHADEILKDESSDADMLWATYERYLHFEKSIQVAEELCVKYLKWALEKEYAFECVYCVEMPEDIHDITSYTYLKSNLYNPEDSKGNLMCKNCYNKLKAEGKIPDYMEKDFEPNEEEMRKNPHYTGCMPNFRKIILKYGEDIELNDE